MPLSQSLILHAGPHPRQDCPVRFTLPEPLPEGEWELIAADTDHPLPLQRLGGNEAAFIETDLPAGQSRRYNLRPRNNHFESSVQLKQEKHALAVIVNDFLLTRYIYGDVPARPYFFPLLLPPGIGLTRVFPMQTDIPGETQDHPHHRSLWIAHGDVNGADNWSEETGHGFTVHQSVDRLESGEVCGGFATTSLWTDKKQAPVLTQHLEVRAWALNGTTRLIDFTIWLTATHGSVTFGDTKEGGILSARVASALDVPRGGRIENSYGGIDEAETWGKAAHWCDYSGMIEEHHAGLAIMDHPLSFRYPTHWHVRDYGLMTANPFGYAAYTQGLKNGSHTLPAGESLRFQYRLALHEGDAAIGRIRERYLDFVSPPRMELEPSSS